MISRDLWELVALVWPPKLAIFIAHISLLLQIDVLELPQLTVSPGWLAGWLKCIVSSFLGESLEFTFLFPPSSRTCSLNDDIHLLGANNETPIHLATKWFALQFRLLQRWPYERYTADRYDALITGYTRKWISPAYSVTLAGLEN